MLNYILESREWILFDTNKKIVKAKNSINLNNLIKKLLINLELTEDEDKLWTSIKRNLSINKVNFHQENEEILDKIELNSYPMIITPYEIDKIRDQIELGNKRIIPIILNDNEVLIGPLVKELEQFETYILRLKSNYPMLRKKINLKLGVYNIIYKNKELVKKYEDEILKCLKKVEKEGYYNKVICIENNKSKIHKFQKFKNSKIKITNKKLDLMDAVDDKLGIVTHLKTESLVNIGVDIYVSVSTTTDYSIYDEILFAQSNSGAGFDKKCAEYSAVGESIERLAAGCYNPKTILASWKELGDKAVSPEKFILFSNEQYKWSKFPYKKFDNNLKVNWIESINLTENIKEYIPVALVKLPYKATQLEERITPSLSTGLALGKSREQAILNGIFEVVERDAFAVSWFLRLAPNRKLNIREYIKNFDLICDNNYICNAYDISIDNLFNTVLVTMHDSKTNNFMIGSATRFSIEESIKKAFLEASQGITYVTMLVNKYKDEKMIENFTKINTFQKHAAFYSIYPEARDRVQYILSKNYTFKERNDSKFDYKNILNLSDKEKLQRAIDILKSNGNNVNYVDLTTKEIEDLGVSAARVIVPGLHPLHGSHIFRFLNPKRLDKFRQKYNLGGGINNFPHPFP